MRYFVPIGPALTAAALLIITVPYPPLRAATGEIFVGNHGVGPSGFATVARFSGSADGDVPPNSEFFVNNATAIARDQQGNIYVASDTGNQIQVYSADAMGQASRLRNIQGSNTMLHRPTGIALDAQGNLYVAERGGPTNPSAVLKFAPGADGNTAPIAIIPSKLPPPTGGNAMNTQLDIACGVAADPDGSLYVVTCPEFQRGGASSLLKFDPGANGDVPPRVSVTTGLSDPQQVALGLDHDIYVSNRGANPSVAVYAANLATNSTPLRTITSTDLRSPSGIAVDNTGQIFVADPDQQSVLVFATGATGNVAPLRKIRGPATALSDPLGIALDTCSSPMTSCNGQCTDTTTDPQNCNGCGNLCTGGTCVDSACRCPPDHLTLCPASGSSHVCADLTSDPNNCHACGVVCFGGRTCVDSACVCPSGQTICGGRCVDLQFDNDNCGSCGHHCRFRPPCNRVESGCETCENGECVPF